MSETTTPAYVEAWASDIGTVPVYPGLYFDPVRKADLRPGDLLLVPTSPGFKTATVERVEQRANQIDVYLVGGGGPHWVDINQAEAMRVRR